MRSIRRAGLLACLLLLALTLARGAGAQAGPFLRISALTEDQINNPRFTFFEFSYDVRGSSIWGPRVPGSQSLDLNLPLVSPTWSQKLGEFFDPCPIIDCEFGAGLEASLSATSYVGIHASADAGSVDLHCPVGVGIDYPKASDLVPGKPFTIQTWYYVEPTAYMNINAPHVDTLLTGRIQAKLDIALIAEAFGDKFVDINLFHLLGLDSPSIDGSATILDTGNLLPVGQDYPLPIPPNIGYGFFHVPNLGARGTIRNDTLKARAADNFLTFHADVTNLLLQYAAFGLPIPFNGHYDVAGFYVDWHLLDLFLDAALGVRQDFVFDPRPTITFKTLGGLTKTIRAGESVTFTAPLYSPLILKPTITFDNNSFSDKFSATFTPALGFTLVQIAGGGRAFGHNLFSFNLNPFGTQTLTDTYAYPLFDQSFALPHPNAFTCPPYVFGASALAPAQFGNITRVLKSGAGNDISGQLNGPNLPDHVILHIEGEGSAVDHTVSVNADGFFQDFLNYYEGVALHPYRPLTVTGRYPDPDNPNAFLETNPATIYWPRPPVDPANFGTITFNHDTVPNGQLVALKGAGKFHLPVKRFDLDPQATLLYDDLPIATDIAYQGATDNYLLTGDLPGFVLDRGGFHTISFLNSGLNQTPVVLQRFLVNNPVPTVTDTLVKKAKASGSPFLLVRGSGFTVDTSVSIGGQSRAVTLVAPTELNVALLPADLAPGTHPVNVANPAPGGGSASSSYVIAAPIADNPLLAARHSLMRHQKADGAKLDDDTVADLITLTNTGKNVLENIVVTSVNLIVNGKTFASSGLPKSLPVLRPGGYSGVQVVFPAHSSVPGDTAVIQVRGTVHGKAFVLSARASMPAFDL